MDQVTNRLAPPPDVQKLSVNIPMIYSENDEWACNVKLNTALLELRRRGGGPVHINLETAYSEDFTLEALPEVRVIRRIEVKDSFPTLQSGKIAVFAGAHRPFDKQLTQAVDAFCARYDAVVFCDHCSGYKGAYRAFASLIHTQRNCDPALRRFDTLIHIGEVAIGKMWLKPREVWRICPDGEVRDPFRKLSHVFEMEEEAFFRHYASERSAAPVAVGERQIDQLKLLCGQTLSQIPELPFSNIWMAQQIAHRLPERAVLHLGILNSARSWNLFEVPETVDTYVNTGGYGIDGCVSALLGASLADPGRLHFGVVGDLAFFYDMNALGNRHIRKNLRLLVVNNGCGAEFQLYNHPCKKSGFAEDTAPFMAAAGHFGCQSRQLIRHYAEDLGFTYFSATDKESFQAQAQSFLNPDLTDSPMLFEVFTTPKDESDALEKIKNLTD